MGKLKKTKSNCNHFLENSKILAISFQTVPKALGSHREAGLAPDSKVSISANRQFYQLSDGAKSFESPALFGKLIASLLVVVV